MKILLPILTLWFSIAYANEELAQKLKDLDPDINSVTTDGYWEAEGKNGQYRIIETKQGFDLARSSIFLQWIQIDVDNGSISVIHSISITEINSDMWCFFKKAVFNHHKKSYILSFQKRGDGSEPSEVSEKTHTATLMPDGLGNYKFSQ